jgi:hypothetical protein
MFTLQPDGGIVAGCRNLSAEDAEAHWGNPYHHKHAESMTILTALKSIEATRNNKE